MTFYLVQNLDDLTLGYQIGHHNGSKDSLINMYSNHIPNSIVRCYLDTINTGNLASWLLQHYFIFRVTAYKSRFITNWIQQPLKVLVAKILEHLQCNGTQAFEIFYQIHIEPTVDEEGVKLKDIFLAFHDYYPNVTQPQVKTFLQARGHQILSNGVVQKILPFGGVEKVILKLN